MRILLKHCALADQEHAKSKRQYAHTFHHDERNICVAKAFENLTENQIWAIIAHEVGHLLVGYEKSVKLKHKSCEMAANRAANKYFGIKIKYRDSKNGRHLQTITDKEVRKVQMKLMSTRNDIY